MEKRRSIPVAVLLSLAMPGLGHLYCGRLAWSPVFWMASFLGWGAFLIGFGTGALELDVAYPVMLVSILLVWVASAVHAGLTARKTPPGYAMRGYNLWYFYLLVWNLGSALPNWALWKYTRSSVLATYPLLSDGMIPTLLPGDWILVDRRSVALEDLTRGAVVAALDPADGATVRILRVAGLPADVLELTPTRVILNGQKVSRREVSEETVQRKTPEGAWVDQNFLRVEEDTGTVKYAIFMDPDPARRRTVRLEAGADQVVLLGDNRMDAVDSTTFGPVSMDSLLGRAILVRRSWNPKTREPRKERKGLEIR
jgi:signal peptidase I